MNDLNFVYKFRSIESLIGKHNELENQSLYFSSPDDLNDPLEGLKDLFWEGDEIIWKNLFKHYLMCTEFTCSIYITHTQGEVLTSQHIPIFKYSDDFENDFQKLVFNEIKESFFSNENIIKLIKFLAQRKSPVRAYELIYHLYNIHPLVISTIFKVYSNHGIFINYIDQNIINKYNERPMFDAEKLEIFNIVEEEKESSLFENIEDVYRFMHVERDLKSLSFKMDGKLQSQRKEMLYLNYPNIYVKELEKIMHTNWYVSCFLDSCTNPAMWGYYADKHKGVCLKFKIDNSSKPHINLHGKIGIGGSKTEDRYLYGDKRLAFHKVTYSNTRPKINFFKTIGNISQYIMEKDWYTDEVGNFSSCASEIYKAQDSWRNNYWSQYYEGITSKLEGWSHETEYRLILDSSLVTPGVIADRVLKYRLRDLDGIIFGINTTIEDKIKIIKVLDDLCNKNDYFDIKLYQAFYKRDSKELGIEEIKSYKFSKNV